jgi:hypothetical protein
VYTTVGIFCVFYVGWLLGRCNELKANSAPCWSHCLLTYVLIYSMEQSPSWEANQFVTSHEIPHILWNPKVHYHMYNCPPPVSILSQPNPVPTCTSHFLKIHPNIILPYMSGSPHWSHSLRFPHQKSIHTSILSCPCYMPRLSHSSQFYYPNNIG